jgi:uncharacterized protein YdiU (UPF0061 family)
MQWNMARLAECLVPLINEEKDEALALLESTIMNITEKYHARYYSMMRAKLGLLDEVASKTTPAVLNEVIDEFLHYLKKNRLDYTRAFVSLMDLLKKQDHSSFDSDWTDKWLSLVQAGDTEKSLSVMQKSNPVVIPRNHHVEDVLQACKASNSSESAIAMLKVILQPYNVVDETISYQDSPLNGDRGYQTFCGT